MAVLDENGVPRLAIGEESRKKINQSHEAYLETQDEEHLRLGAVVVLDNKRPIHDPSRTSTTTFRIGSETIDEALKTIVGAFDGFHGHESPRWVASTDPEIAEYLAEHYDCKVKDIANVLK